MRGSIRRRGKGSFELQIELDRRGWQTPAPLRPGEGQLSRTRSARSPSCSAAADAGTLPADPSSATVAEYLRAWLDGASQVSPRTLESVTASSPRGRSSRTWARSSCNA